MSTTKFHCYVDETGQDTEGCLFIVSVIILQEKDDSLPSIEGIEVKTGKGKFKWGRSGKKERLRYLSEIFAQKTCPLKCYFSIYKQTKEYKTSTILTIVKVIQSIKNFTQYKFVVYVDALNEKDQEFYGSQMRKLGVPSRKVRGIRKDESNALIRLADSVCGFIRDVIEEKDQELTKLYEKALKRRVLIEV